MIRGTEIECKVEPDGSGYARMVSGEATFTNTLGESFVLKTGQTITFDRAWLVDSKKSTAVPEESKTAEDVVRQFYAALRNGQGDVASQLVVPEKRARGPFSAEQLTRFYGHLVEPISLIEVSARGSNEYLVRYHYVAAKIRCDGRAIVRTVVRGGQTYIERIDALNGC